MGPQAFFEAGVLAATHSKLKTEWLFGGEAHLVVSRLNKEIVLWSGTRHPVTMHKASSINLSMRQM